MSGFNNPPVMVSGTVTEYSNWVYVDGSNTTHLFTPSMMTASQSINCPSSEQPPGGYGFPPSSATGISNDGYTISITNASEASVVSKTGRIVTPGYGATCNSQSSLDADSNGNEITENCGVYTDTLGQTALTILGSTSSPPVAFTSSNASGSSTAVLAYTAKTVQTKFNCPAVIEYGPIVVNLPTKLTLPDGRFYSFSYEATPGIPGNVTGRLASVKLPSGGTISYTYSGGDPAANGINCADGSTAILSRTTPDSTTPTTYSRDISHLSSTGYEITTITPPTGDLTKITSVAPDYGTSYIANFYEVARQIFSGSSSLLETILTCYDASASNCSIDAGGSRSHYGAQGALSGGALPPAVRTTTQWPDNSGISAGTIDLYDSIENQTSHAVYDYGAPSSGAFSDKPLQTTSTKYAFLNSSETGSPSDIQVLDSSKNIISHAIYSYNEYPLTATTGTPQQIPSNSQMNLTTVQTLVSGGTYLTTHNTYYDTGQVNIATDVNGGQTTYTYGSSSCGNSFPTSVSSQTGGSVVTSLTTSATWNCTGGVQLTSKDVNGNWTTYAYGSDPYWRPTSITNNATTAVTSYTYPTASSNSSSVAMKFNGGSSISEALTTYDSMGRTLVQQTPTSPSLSSYNSVSFAYDNLGRLNCQSIPYSTATAGGYEGAGAGNWNCTSFDALNRPFTYTDAGGGTVNYTYNQNDVTIAVGPAPSGEHTKQRSLQYDGAGELTSVCEITSMAGSGSCAQNTAHTGYLTQYTYVAGRLIQTQQNVQAGSGKIQTRRLAYDGLGRKTSETIPEWSAGTGSGGTATYVYDSDSSGVCSGTFAGDLVKSVDSAGNVTCSTYDLLHRSLSSKVASGAYASVTPLTYAVYDAATLSGTAMANAKGTVAEAYTCTGSCTTKLTDVFFSTSPFTSGSMAGGVEKQMWESTPHSGGYFETQEVYYPNGVLGDLQAWLGTASIGIPRTSYQVDGAGRPYSATESSHNLVTATLYNVAGAPTGITYGNTTGGSSDTDSFTYDPSTFRPTQLAYAVNPTANPFTVTNGLTWNANGSLQQLVHTDTGDSAKNQTCNYSADDLSRIASVNCGSSTWAQTFSYDAFGNIAKGGSSTYAAAYSAVTNQVSGGISPAPLYDANGNQKNLTSGGTGVTISWNAAAQPITINGTSATYDALGRMVETGSGSTWEQFVYRPSGDSLAVYSGSLIKGTIPLPGGTTALYNQGGLNFIRHTDWLGSSVLGTTWAHTVYSKEAYAPFGETYNEAGTPDRSFTGQDQDVVSGTGGTGVYDFLYRKHDPSAGRWLSPDPAGWAAVDLSDPQSLNRYGYVVNRPLTLIDLFGLCPQRESTWITINGVVYPGSLRTTDDGTPCIPPPPGCIYTTNAEGTEWTGTDCSSDSGVWSWGNPSNVGGNSGPSGPGGGSGGAPNNGGGGMNGRSPLYPYGHDILVIPIPTCKGMDTTGDVVGGAGAVGTIGFGIASLTSAGAASPITVPGLTVSGIAWASGNLLNILAKHGIGCTGSL